MDEAEPPEDRRGSQRACVDIECDVRIGTASWQRAGLTDLTPEGFRMRRSPMWGLGAAVWIRISGLAPLSATIRWVERDFVGCRFNSPLSEYIFDNIVQQASQLR